MKKQVTGWNTLRSIPLVKYKNLFVKVPAATFSALILLLAACDQNTPPPQAATPAQSAEPQATVAVTQKIPAVTQTPADRSYRYGTVISFGRGGEGPRYQVSGWSTPEEVFTWTDKPTAVLAFKIPPAQSPLELRISLEGLTGAGLPFQPVRLEANGKQIASWEVSSKQDFIAMIPADVAGAADTLTLTLYMPKATTPASLGMNKDNRTLGVHCFELQISQK